ncbi:MAG: hypothetical protein ACFKPT_00995 [Gloeotrichia echinulata GP01]
MRKQLLGVRDWGLGIGDWGLGIGDLRVTFKEWCVTPQVLAYITAVFR